MFALGRLMNKSHWIVQRTAKEVSKQVAPIVGCYEGLVVIQGLNQHLVGEEVAKFCRYRGK